MPIPVEQSNPAGSNTSFVLFPYLGTARMDQDSSVQGAAQVQRKRTDLTPAMAFTFSVEHRRQQMDSDLRTDK